MSSVEELLTSARTALEAHDTLVARGYLRRAAHMAPDRLDIWVDLCRVTERPEDRAKCLERIVELDPANAEAQQELRRLRAGDLSSGAPRAGALHAGPGSASASTVDVPQADIISSEDARRADVERTEQEPNRQGTAAEAADRDQETEPEPPTPEFSPPRTSGMRLDITDEMRQQWAEAVAAGRPLFCIDHPNRETVLRCNQCDAPVCTSCVVRTPVGFRCKECIKAQQAIFFNAFWYDYPLAALIALALSVPAAFVTSLIGWWFALIISPFAGGLIGGAVHWAIGRRRGRWIWLVVAVCVVLGAFVAWSVRPRAALTIAIYAATATGAAIGALRMRNRR